jgi:hypothetical protein
MQAIHDDTMNGADGFAVPDVRTCELDVSA